MHLGAVRAPSPNSEHHDRVLKTEFGKKIIVLLRRQSVLTLLYCTHWTAVSRSCEEAAYLGKTRWWLPTKGCWTLLPFTVSYLHTFGIVSGKKNERQSKAWAWFRNSLDSVFENVKGFSSAPSPGRNQRLPEVSNCDLESQFLRLNQSLVWGCKMDPARGSCCHRQISKGGAWICLLEGISQPEKKIDLRNAFCLKVQRGMQVRFTQMSLVTVLSPVFISHPAQSFKRVGKGEHLHPCP